MGEIMTNRLENENFDLGQHEPYDTHPEIFHVLCLCARKHILVAVQ